MPPWVSGLLLQFMRAHLHVLVVLQCIVFRASCSALVFFPSLPSLIIIIISSSSIVLISPLNSWFSVTGAWAGAECGGRGSKQGCRQDFGVFLLPGLGAWWLQPPGS